MKDFLANLAVQIQQVPAPTFDEKKRAEFMLEMFRQNGLSRLEIDPVGNVLACLPGTGADSPLLVSAHLDTVFPAETDLAIRREPGRIYGPGIGDNSTGLAGLIGLVTMLKDENISLPGDLWLVANTCEEGLGDLKGMKAICERFGDSPLLYLVLEGMALGHIYHRAIGVRRYKITCHTRGGHSWTDYGNPSAIHELARLVTALDALKLPDSPRTTLNIGRIAGGTSINTLAPEAWLELDLRSENESTLQDLIRLVERLVENSNRPGVWFELQVIGQRPAGELDRNHPLVRHAKNSISAQGIEPRLTLGSTDANIPLSRGYPSLVLGLTTGGGAHTRDEYIETEPLEQGAQHLFSFVCGAWKA
ncbi:MAG: peptidase M20 [Chloroflexi bacterium HGW-Chloroflexi-6]|nr:MAG: peptidase M20 [Chloroflexi bacterium HGW-Chloroflexi-6]